MKAIITIKQTALALLSFIKNPIPLQDKDQSNSKKLKSFFSILAIDIPITIVLAFLIVGFEELGWVDTDNNKIDELLKSSSVFTIILLTVFIVPFIEELIFRLFLKWERNYLLQFIIYIFPKTRDKLHTLWNVYFGYVFYVSVIAFGLIHITNYKDDNLSVLIVPFLVLPQLAAGILIGFLRVRYNFMLGFFMHALHNAIFVVVALVSMENFPNEKINITNDDFTLTVEEVSFDNSSLIKYSEADTIQFEATSLKTVLSTINKVDEGLIDTNDSKALNQKLNIYLVKNTNQNIDKDSLILTHLKKMYNFNIKNQKREQIIYQLYKQDPVKYNRHLSKEEEDATSTIITKNKIEFKNASLHQIAKTLSKHYHLMFEVDTITNQRFSFKLKKENFPNLESKLQDDFGIGIRRVEKQVIYMMVDFN